MKSYPRFPRRLTELLDGSWDFAWLGPDAKLDAIKPDKIEYDEKMAVPGVFDTGIDRFGVRGTGVYRRKIRIEAKPGDTLRLKIGGLGLYGKIFWDGKAVGECKLPYSYVDYDFKAGRGPGMSWP
jgi:hypothetical protein